ncbi:copper resistance protein NlpE N-terminal domain-containing protein [Rubrolithibacter danxiaensis]|uniref:copper resistance protein NlpE N-terminal domain-containing protein n=1 Tax=Rubrolithibacter danxiaensis TaxID=3390805 RepID=UPI003BF90093
MKIKGLLAIGVCFLFSCVIKPEAQKRRLINVNDTIRSESYQGIIPCADCPGIKTTLKLVFGRDSTYTLSETYLERNNGKAFLTEGSFRMEQGYDEDPNAVLIILNPGKTDGERYYLRFSKNPEVLLMLTANRELIDSKLNFKLIRVEK